MPTVTYHNSNGTTTTVQQNSKWKEISRSTTGGSSSSSSSGSSGSSSSPKVSQPPKQAGESIEEYVYRTNPAQYGGKAGDAESQRLNQQAAQMASNGGYYDNSQSARNGVEIAVTPSGQSVPVSAGVAAKSEKHKYEHNKPHRFRQLIRISKGLKYLSKKHNLLINKVLQSEVEAMPQVLRILHWLNRKMKLDKYLMHKESHMMQKMAVPLRIEVAITSAMLTESLT